MLFELQQSLVTSYCPKGQCSPSLLLLRTLISLAVADRMTSSELPITIQQSRYTYVHTPLFAYFRLFSSASSLSRSSADFLARNDMQRTRKGAAKKRASEAGTVLRKRYLKMVWYARIAEVPIASRRGAVRRRLTFFLETSGGRWRISCSRVAESVRVDEVRDDERSLLREDWEMTVMISERPDRPPRNSSRRMKERRWSVQNRALPDDLVGVGNARKRKLGGIWKVEKQGIGC